MIKLCKLVSNEFVIGRFIDTLLTNVAVVRFESNPHTGEQGLKMLPYMYPITQSLAKIITIDKVMYMEDAPQQMQISYLEMIKTILQKIEGSKLENDNGSNGVSETNKNPTGEIGIETNDVK